MDKINPKPLSKTIKETIDSRMLFMIVVLANFLSTISLAQSSEKVLRLDVSRDTWVSGVGDEAFGSNGASPRLKLKSIQELSLIDFDIGSLRGKQIRSANLFLKVASDQSVDRITVSSINSPWHEGQATSYGKEDGASTFSHASYPNQRWWDGDITSVILGNGNSRWESIQPEILPNAWIKIKIPVDLIEARIAGASFGFVLFDDTGSEWNRDGETFEHLLFPNRFVFSRNSNRSSAPYLEVEVGENDQEPPDAPFELRWQNDSNYFLGSLIWKYRTAKTENIAVAFRILVDGKEIPSYFVPKPSNDGLAVLRVDPKSPAWDLDNSHIVEICTVDGAGNQSTPSEIRVPKINHNARLSELKQKLKSIIRRSEPAQFESSQAWPTDPKQGSVAVVDPLDKFLSKEKILPAQRKGYLFENAIWDSQVQQINLHASRGMWIGFQLASLHSNVLQELKLKLPTELAGAQSEVSRYVSVESENGPIHDPLLLLEPTSEGLMWQWNLRNEHHKYANGEALPESWLVELYIPESISQGKYEIKMDLKGDGVERSMLCMLKVHDPLLPSELTFLPEMNCYDIPTNEKDYYRLANRHRVVLNRVPYYQNGKMAEGLAPQWNEGKLVFTEWDRRFAEYFDGSAFQDLPRGKQPIECFYLPLHENWPLTMQDNYRGGYWANSAFPDSYRKQWQDTVTSFAQHFQEKNWSKTRFHVFLNNKVDFKKRGWSRGSSVWLLDEPANFQDFDALRYFGIATREGLLKSGSAKSGSLNSENILFRADISRPQWQRDALDGLLQYNVVSQTAFRTYPRLVLERRAREGQKVVIYGSANHPTLNNSHGVVWCWDTWCRGADGVLPWQTMGTEESWKKADELSLFYPSVNGSKPAPSIRLKAYCTGEQDIELLNLLAKKLGCTRYELGEVLLEQLSLRSESRVRAGVEEDAGWADYGQRTPEEFSILRTSLLQALDR